MCYEIIDVDIRPSGPHSGTTDITDETRQRQHRHQHQQQQQQQQQQQRKRTPRYQPSEQDYEEILQQQVPTTMFEIQGVSCLFNTNSIVFIRNVARLCSTVTSRSQPMLLLW